MQIQLESSRYSGLNDGVNNIVSRWIWMCDPWKAPQQQCGGFFHLFGTNFFTFIGFGCNSCLLLECFVNSETSPASRSPQWHFNFHVNYPFTIFYLHIPDQTGRPHTPSWGWRGAPALVCSRSYRNRDFHRSRGHTSSTSSVSGQKLHNRNISMCVVNNNLLIESVVSFPAGIQCHTPSGTNNRIRSCAEIKRFSCI